MDKQAEELLIPLSSDECGHSGGEPDSDEDVITNYLDMLPRPTVGPLPTISVTPHSPASKIYPVLEDSLQQVRELHESVQHMRNVTVQNSYGTNSKDFAFALNPLLAQVARLSASCPALNEVVPDLDILGGSLGSSPLHQPPSRKGSGTQDWLCQPETQRRRSWTALEDLTGNKDKVKSTRQRSISLSSMESEADESSLIDNVDGSTVRLLGPDAPIVVRHRGARGTGGTASTHSLNEADLQNDFNKIKAKREAEQLRLPQRLPLQKSISTPSIIAVRDLAPEPILQGAQPTLPVSRPSGTESETEEEGSRSSGQAHYDTHSVAHLQYVAYDRNVEKRRKRGSLFFRKKKDKSKKITHQWVSACYGSSQTCDVCSKPLSNKPALYCECCGTTVHQNTCKDNILECNKPKGSKNANKITAFAVPLPNSKSSTAKRGSASLSSNNQNSSTTSQILYDDKDTDSHHSHHDATNFPDDVPLVPLEFLSDSPLTASDLCSDISLGLHEIEPDSWTPHVGKEVARKLKEKEVKRQEHIYEFILTEKHHCMTLLVMQKVFVDGLQKYFQLGPSLERMFPRLTDLIDLHLGLLYRLRQRQREGPVVSTIADILLEQFSNNHAAKLKSAYGEFCSRHRDAVDIYKYYLQNDARFAQFVRHCQTNPLLKKKGIPECILFVTQRLTKYPLLIEPLIKTSKENRQEQEALQRALSLVKEILVEVDSQVAEKEKEDRKLEIYNRIDAKSYTVHRDHKFKKSDILQGNRSLKFEGVAMLMQGRGKMQIVLVIVLSDVLFFLQENSQKYSFFTPDNKAGVVSLQKLLVREKAGQDSRGIYLISSNPADPEMFELKVHKPKDKQVWIQAIREAVQSCPEEEEESVTFSAEERQSMLNAKQNQVKNLVGQLRQKDIEQALLLEEKMSLQLKLLTAAGVEHPPSPPSYRHLVENADTGQMWREVITAVQEVSHLASSLYTTGTNLSRSVSSAGEHQSDAYVSPILPKRAETFGGFDNSTTNQTAPFKLLGKKTQTSAGGTPTAGTPDLDMYKPGDSRLFERLPYRNCVITGAAAGGIPLLPNGNIHSQQAQQTTTSEQQAMLQHNHHHHNMQSQTSTLSNSLSVAPPDGPALLSLGREQQYAAIQLQHYVYTLLCIISQLMTSNETIQAQFNTLKSEMNSLKLSGGGDGTGSSGGGGGTGAGSGGPLKQYRHNQQLEELRNLQDKLSGEKAAWMAVRDQEAKDLEEKKAELLRLQEQIRSEQEDITQQREQLYRKMEILTSQGLLISPNVALPVVTAGQLAASNTDNSSGSKDSSEADSSPQSDSSSTAGAAPSIVSSNTGNNSNNQGGGCCGSSTLTYSASTVERKKDSKWNKGTITGTNQPKVPQNLPVKQQLPLKLASRVSSGGKLEGVTSSSSSSSNSNSCSASSSSASSSGGNGQQQQQQHPQQVLPLKLSQQQNEKIRRTSTSGYQRLGSDSFSPPSGETTPTMMMHSRTGSSPAMMQQVSSSCCTSPTGTLTGGAPPPYQHHPHHHHHHNVYASGGSSSSSSSNANKASRTHTYPKIPDKYKHHQAHVIHPPGGVAGASSPGPAAGGAASASEEEVLYF